MKETRVAKERAGFSNLHDPARHVAGALLRAEFKNSNVRDPFVPLKLEKQGVLHHHPAERFEGGGGEEDLVP